MSVNIHALYRRLARFRKNRMERFIATMKPDETTRILDIGGYSGTWIGSPVQSRVTLLNLPQYSVKPVEPDGFDHVFGDGTKLDYADGAFDIAFSNSVIEHVGDFEAQRAFASEVRRVGRSYWIQTPAREFILDPHTLTPFIHWLPTPWIPPLVHRFTVWSWMTRATSKEARHFWAELKLRPLTYREMKFLFPDAQITVERLLGMPKSYIAWRTG